MSLSHESFSKEDIDATRPNGVRARSTMALGGTSRGRLSNRLLNPL